MRLGWTKALLPALLGGRSGVSPPGDARSGGGASVLQFHHHMNRDGFYVDPAITRAAAATMHRDTTFDGAVSSNVYAQLRKTAAGCTPGTLRPDGSCSPAGPLTTPF